MFHIFTKIHKIYKKMGNHRNNYIFQALKIVESGHIFFEWPRIIILRSIILHGEK